MFEILVFSILFRFCYVVSGQCIFIMFVFVELGVDFCKIRLKQIKKKRCIILNFFEFVVDFIRYSMLYFKIWLSD